MFVRTFAYRQMEDRVTVLERDLADQQACVSALAKYAKQIADAASTGFQKIAQRADAFDEQLKKIAARVEDTPAKAANGQPPDKVETSELLTRAFDILAALGSR